MAQMQRAACFQIVQKDAAYLGAATHVIDGRPREFAETLAETEFRIVYRAGRIDRNNAGEPDFPEFPIFVDACFFRGDMTMIIDEAHLLCDPFHIPPAFFEALVLGRHESLSSLYVAQSFSMVHRLLTRQTSEFYFWRIIEPSDLEGIKKRCGSDVAERVAGLRRLEDHRPEGGILTPGEVLHWTTWEGIVNHSEEKNKNV
jgi:hypothetical protein